MSWTNLVMWDNISFYYIPNKPVSKDQLKEIKKLLNGYINNVVYDGYIKANMVDMKPEISYNRYGQVEYNVSAYPKPLPKNCPEDIFSVLPESIEFNDLVLTKKDWHGV